MNTYLADTTVLVEHLRGNLHAKQFIIEHTPSISTVTIAELIQGSKNKEDRDNCQIIRIKSIV